MEAAQGKNNYTGAWWVDSGSGQVRRKHAGLTDAKPLRSGSSRRPCPATQPGALRDAELPAARARSALPGDARPGQGSGEDWEVSG